MDITEFRVLWLRIHVVADIDGHADSLARDFPQPTVQISANFFFFVRAIPCPVLGPDFGFHPEAYLSLS